MELHRVKVELLSKEYKNQTDELKKLEQKLEETKKAHSEDSEEVKKAQKEYDTQASKVRKLDSDIGTATATLNRYTKEMDVNTASIKDQSSETGKLDKTKRAYGENSKEVKDLETKLNNAKTEVVEFKNKLDDIEQGASNAGDGLDQLNQNVQSITLFEMADALSELSQKLVEFGKAAMTAFDDYDAGMDIIVTKTGATGTAAEEFGEIYDRVTSSMFTQSFDDVGSAIGELNTQFGLTGDALTKASEYMLMFADINGTDVTSASIAAKQAIEAYGLSNEDLAFVLDSVTSTAQATGQSVDSLFEKAVTGAPQIKALGLSFGEGVQLMGDFEKAGLS